MSKNLRYAIMLSMVLLFSGLFAGVSHVGASDQVQQPTVAIPTVTGTARGPSVRVDPNANEDQINVRAGPGTDYAKVGVLIIGEEASAIGRSFSGEWIQIVYPGVEGAAAWVYSRLVTLSSSQELPIIEPPPTPTPRVTPTIDPTLAAQFVFEPQPTRLPTFTAPPPLVIATYEAGGPGTVPSAGLPMGLIIILLAVVGAIGMLVSFLRQR